ncbi:condensation domain-containing protein [Mycobacterium hubeiense]|uniref:condensation domain-containing protein n=1 Tax=Mycobacterium hubeiense TaxID=1867256 RepID=UPI000C7F2A9E|nr:condensation domain-containing protein [Mycobacterium sp. QGD 101]
MFAIATIEAWEPGPGSIVCWHASPSARAKAAIAPVSAVPPSYQQAQHLRRYRDHVARGLDMSRLMIFTWDMPGRCDIRAMTYILNAHLRRHHTYRSWFEYTDGDRIVRHTIADPADIEVVPTEHGDMSAAELRTHILAPHPLQWDCFLFGIVQGAERFTFYASIEHLCVDPMVMGVLFAEIHMMYAALVGGSAPIQLPQAGSYDDYCIRQHEYTSALSVKSPEVRAWIEFAANNGGTLPRFPLPLGDLSVPCAGDLRTVTLLDRGQTERFENACMDVGARFSGGVFACAALAEHELTGADAFYGLTPIDTRATPAELTTTGWFTGLLPVTVADAGTSFSDAVCAAQSSFDSGSHLAKVPFDRVVELAPPRLGLGRPQPGNLVMSYLDASIAPLSTVANSDLNFRIHNEGRVSHQVSLWVTRLEHETTVTVLFPNNPVARESVEDYIAALKSVYVRVAEGWRTGRLHKAATA